MPSLELTGQSPDATRLLAGIVVPDTPSASRRPARAGHRVLYR